MDALETLCRIICEADGVDPDRESIGCGGVIPRDQPYQLWQARERQATALIAAGYGRPEPAIRHDVALQLLAKAQECDARAKALGRPAGSTEHMCGNVWRAATTIVDPEVLKPHSK